MSSKMTFYILLSLIIAFISKGDCQIYTYPVYTESGPIVGLYEKTVLAQLSYASYRGIPFAEPPITKSHRFKPPIPIKPWNQELYATADKERCIQVDGNQIVGSEDCLYLNIYEPKIQTSDNRLKPVIVWIHGGAFTTGNGNSSYYGPDFLLEQNVVVASIQYRLGPLGFLNLNHPDATGNAGLKDQVLALRWIHKNIQYFGGDPSQITLLGQSAGGVSVDLHKLSDMSVGLFSKTISMSASPLCKYWPFQSNVEAKSQAFSLGTRLGSNTNDPNKLLETLLNASVTDLINKTSTLPLIPFRPTLEKTDVAINEEKFLTECTPKKYKEGNYTKGPHLMGYTSTEILSMAKSLEDLVQYYKDAAINIKSYDFINWLPVVPEVLSSSFTTIADFKKIASNALIKELSDIYFATGIDMKQRLLSNKNDAPIFYYKYDFQSEYSAHKAEGVKILDGVAHEDELPHIFYRPHLNLPLNNPKIKFIRDRLVWMWTNFAKYGHPTPYGENDPILKVTWPDSRGNGTHLEIANELRVNPDRPTNVLITLYQKFGFGDCSIYNDCDVGLLNEIVNSFVNLPAKAQDIVAGTKNAVNKIADSISGTADKISDTVGNITGTAMTIVSDAEKKAANAANNVATDVKKSVGKAAGGVEKSVSQATTGILNKTSDIFSGVAHKIKFPFGG